jgi:hypothetical protein
MNMSMRLIYVIICCAGLGLVSSAIPLAGAQSSDSASVKSDSLQQQIVAAEREGLEALKTGNVDHFAELTAEDAVFVDAAGPANKAQVVSNVADLRLTVFSMDDIQFVQLSPTSGLIVYKVTEKGLSHGREFAAQAYISSIWAQQNGKWVCRFSQETTPRTPKPAQP